MTGAEISPVPREARAYQGAPAGIVTRVVANTIDAAVVGVVLGGCYLGFASVVFLLDPRTFTFPSTGFGALLTAALAIATGYLWLAWWLVGRTYGDHVMGIRVTGRRRPRLGPLRALGRAAFCVVFPIGLFWCLVSPKRRSIQDIAVFSSVVYDWMPRPAGQGAPLADETVATDRQGTSSADAAVAAQHAESASTDGPRGDAAAAASPSTRRRYRRADRTGIPDPVEH